jgi:hypothetical protein
MADLICSPGKFGKARAMRSVKGAQHSLATGKKLDSGLVVVTGRAFHLGLEGLE